DQPVGNEDDPLHVATVKMAAHVPVSQRRGARLFLGEAAGQDETASHLAVDLDDELDGVGRRPSGIVLRPVLAFEEAVGVAKPLPHLLGTVGRDRPDEGHERLDLGPTRAPPTLAHHIEVPMIAAIAVLYRSAAISSVTFPIVAWSFRSMTPVTAPSPSASAGTIVSHKR